MFRNHYWKRYAFVHGPMSALSGVNAEPPCMMEAAEYAARTCPFLVIPTAKRREAGLEDAKELPGVMIKDNPGITAITDCEGFDVRRVDDGVLFVVRDVLRIRWFREGRELTQAEVDDPEGFFRKALEAAASKAVEVSPRAASTIEARLQRVIEKSRGVGA